MNLREPMKQGLRYVAGILPPTFWAGPTYWKWRRFLKEAQYWPPQRIRDWQLERLRAIVRFAYENTEGYRALYDRAGVKPDDLTSLDDIRRLPFVTKEDIRDHLEAFSVKCKRRRYVSTGGSTGIPMGFYKFRRDAAIENAFMHMGWLRAGWRGSAVSAVLRGAFVGTPKRWWHYNPYRRELYLSSYYLTSENVLDYVRLMRRFRARVLQAYPSACHILSDLLLERGQRAEHIQLVLLGSENIYDWQLEKARLALPNARFFGWYGHSEQSVLAPWCEGTRKYHVWPFYGYAELIRPDGKPAQPGEIGEVVGTSFHVMATPFIRYRTADFAVRGADACDACGRYGPLLERIEGRAHELIVTSSGRYISMTAINMHDAIFEPLRQFLFVQERPGHVEFQYIPRRSLTPSELERIQRGLMMKLGADMTLSVREVKEIPRSPLGKLRFLDQKLPVKYGCP